MAAILVSEEEAVRDIAQLLARPGGDEVMIESHRHTVAFLGSGPKGSSVEATLERLKALRERRGGEPLRMGADFPDDLEEIVRNRKPADRSAWD
jgi:hypothetical protein